MLKIFLIICFTNLFRTKISNIMIKYNCSINNTKSSLIQFLETSQSVIDFYLDVVKLQIILIDPTDTFYIF